MSEEDSEREARRTTELDPKSLVGLLATTDEVDKPTVTIRRDRLLELVEQTIEPVVPQHVHTVPRDQIVRNNQNDLIDTNIRPSITPLVWYAMILTVAVVFIAVFRLT